MRRRYWRATALAGLFGLITSVSTGIGIAFAHPGDDETDAEHAKQDLAGTSIEKIEKQTKANATKIKKETGDTPGRKSDEQTVPNARVSAAAAQDPGQGGNWSSVLSTSVVPIFQAVLPNGKVLMWDSVGTGRRRNRCQTTPSPGPWSGTRPPTRPCAGTSAVTTSSAPDIPSWLMAGAGSRREQEPALDGIVQTHIFDWRKETWSRGPDMAAAPLVPVGRSALGNDEAVIVGGGPAIPEVYQTNGTLRRLTTASGYSDRLYAFLTTRPDGQVELMGPPNSDEHHQYQRYRSHHRHSRRGTASTAPMAASPRYDIGKVLVAGGGNITEGGQSNVPTKTAVVVNVNGGTTTASLDRLDVGRAAAAQSHHPGRRQRARDRRNEPRDQCDGRPRQPGVRCRAVGSERPEPGPCCPAPAGYGNTTPAPHCCQTAGYLPAGAESALPASTMGYLEKNIEYFEPPYLYKKDGSGQKASRPVIGSAPATATYGKSSTSPPRRPDRSPRSDWYAWGRQLTARTRDSVTCR